MKDEDEARRKQIWNSNKCNNIICSHILYLLSIQLNRNDFILTSSTLSFKPSYNKKHWSDGIDARNRFGSKIKEELTTRMMECKLRSGNDSMFRAFFPYNNLWSHYEWVRKSSQFNTMFRWRRFWWISVISFLLSSSESYVVITILFCSYFFDDIHRNLDANIV